MALSLCTGTNDNDLLMPRLSSSQNSAAFSIPTPCSRCITWENTVTGWNLARKQVNSHMSLFKPVPQSVVSSLVHTWANQLCFKNWVLSMNYMNYTQWYITQLNAPALWFFLFLFVLVIQNFQGPQIIPDIFQKLFSPWKNPWGKWIMWTVVPSPLCPVHSPLKVVFQSQKFFSIPVVHIVPWLMQKNTKYIITTAILLHALGR